MFAFENATVSALISIHLNKAAGCLVVCLIVRLQSATVLTVFAPTGGNLFHVFGGRSYSGASGTVCSPLAPDCSELVPHPPGKLRTLLKGTNPYFWGSSSSGKITCKLCFLPSFVLKFAHCERRLFWSLQEASPCAVCFAFNESSLCV